MLNHARCKKEENFLSCEISHLEKFLGARRAKMGVTAVRDGIGRVCLNNRTFRDRGAYLRVGIWPANMYDNFDMPTPHNGS